MKFDLKMVLVYVGASALIVIGFSIAAIGVFFFYTEGRDLLNLVLHQRIPPMAEPVEFGHLVIACVTIAIGLFIGYIGVFILKDHRC